MKMIKLKCKTCGHTVFRKKYCPYTGFRHHEGWNYTCECCRGELIEIEDVTAYTCECDRILQQIGHC